MKILSGIMVSNYYNLYKVNFSDLFLDQHESITYDFYLGSSEKIHISWKIRINKGLSNQSLKEYLLGKNQ